jgi:hypothetical protein
MFRSRKTALLKYRLALTKMVSLDNFYIRK